MQTPADTTDESLRTIEFAASDRFLREDVSRLGELVGEILAEQRSPDFLAEVERLRRAAITRRENDEPVAGLAEALADTPMDHASDLVRAFSTYFQAINLAERVHRIRRRREHERAEHGDQPASLRDVIGRLTAQGVGADEMNALLPRLRIEPVFTAHPTEAVRRVQLKKEREVVTCLVNDIDRGRTPAERDADRERMRMALTASWQTVEAPAAKPSVADEFEHVGFYLTDVLYQVLPVFHEAFQAALAEHYEGTQLPDVLGFGSWVGGDMDGNPNVGAATIAATLARQRALVLAAYQADIHKLEDLLSQSLSRVKVADEVIARIDQYRELLPGGIEKLHPRHADMPYRNLLTLMAERLSATTRDEACGYPDAASFVTDIELIHDSLLANRGEHAGDFAVVRLLRRARCFGFHLASLDLRQDSAMHDVALAGLLEDPQWETRDPVDRAAKLHAIMDGSLVPGDADADAARSTLEVFRTVAELRPRYGDRVFGPYIVSMSRSAADALAVLALARLAGCVESADTDAGNGVVPLDVAPLFETIADLEAAADTLRALFADPVYRAHLAARGNRQVVMLGYSDSAKDGGIVASRWSLQQTQIELTALARDSGVQIAFFHGRGGSISRGGGKTERAVIAAPRGSVDGYLRLTEQGEVIHRKYGIRALALRNLEQTTGAVLRATLRPRSTDTREAQWRQVAGQMAVDARAHYRGLIHEHPDFTAYFRAATPIDVIERLRIGSRPSKRAGAGGVESLRAIPWVFSWAQNRSGLTAWYGVGTALERALANHGEEALVEMARDWPFFAALVDDIEMVLATSDMGIFERYSQLAAGVAASTGSGDLHTRMHPGVVAEFNRTRAAVLAIKREDELLAKDLSLRRSIRLRNPYVDPISLLQVDLLARWRAGDRKDDALLRVLMATVNGIAAGIQNTG